MMVCVILSSASIHDSVAYGTTGKLLLQQQEHVNSNRPRNDNDKQQQQH